MRKVYIADIVNPQSLSCGTRYISFFEIDFGNETVYDGKNEVLLNDLAVFSEEIFESDDEYTIFDSLEKGGCWNTYWEI